MKKVLWACVIANLVYSLSEFTNIITPAYIIVLLLLTILADSGNIKATKTLGIISAIVGITLSIFGMGNLIIMLTGIAIIIEVIREKMVVYNQNKYDKNIGVKTEKIKIVSKYDIDIIKDNFDNFISNYDKSNYMIDMKYKHTLGVADNSLNIAKSIGLDEEGRYLAYVIGILHDIGRFEQLKEYNTLDDSTTVNHAEYGGNLLEDGLIRQFIHENKYDKIILKVVRNHNRYSIDDSFTDDEKLYCSIIRDADKLDIFKRLSEGEFKDDYNVTKNMVISSEVVREISKKHAIDVSLVNNELDQVVLRLAMIYDINYKYTLKTIKENDYLNKYILLLDTLDSNKIALKKIVNEIYIDIDNKLK